MRRAALIVVFGLLASGCGGSGSSGKGAENGSIAYTVASGFGAGISIRDPDGHRAHLTTSARDLNPTWSSDGSKIAFERAFGKQGLSHLFVMNADGTHVHQVGDVATSSGGVSWTPDGEIVFGDATGDGGISSIRADGGGLHRIAPRGFAPAVSPDGETIIFLNLPAMFTMHADGSGRRRLLTPPEPTVKSQHLYTIGAPAWAPDGEHLVYVWSDALAFTARDATKIKVMDADGGNERTVTELPLVEGPVARPSWSPDGSLLVFAGRRRDRSGLWTVASGGGTPRLLLEGYEYGQPNWGRGPADT